MSRHSNTGGQVLDARRVERRLNMIKRTLRDEADDALMEGRTTLDDITDTSTLIQREHLHAITTWTLAKRGVVATPRAIKKAIQQKYPSFILEKPLPECACTYRSDLKSYKDRRAAAQRALGSSSEGFKTWERGNPQPDPQSRCQNCIAHSNEQSLRGGAQRARRKHLTRWDGTAWHPISKEERDALDRALAESEEGAQYDNGDDDSEPSPQSYNNATTSRESWNSGSSDGGNYRPVPMPRQSVTSQRSSPPTLGRLEASGRTGGLSSPQPFVYDWNAAAVRSSSPVVAASGSKRLTRSGPPSTNSSTHSSSPRQSPADSTTWGRGVRSQGIRETPMDVDRPEDTELARRGRALMSLSRLVHPRDKTVFSDRGSP
ncbi:hypothetical protein BKA62DRAFT_710122 [Auriculariales sp. MPI-PUGE-AT-0066]|nr:hypothetical protein BKA62DRAFT_710122 [Auriculariales sp. MPI-PUGE-AT-0066]